ncbi:MAG: hypothetical protein OFPII_07810 [Osedax symbiont Rs1]|nr:MAG: hypothetical protein OFPII_07810 [Osedax symbiont Rs1]
MSNSLSVLFHLAQLAHKILRNSAAKVIFSIFYWCSYRYVQSI